MCAVELSRQGDPKSRPLAEHALDDDTAEQRIEKLADDVEPEADAVAALPPCRKGSKIVGRTSGIDAADDIPLDAAIIRTNGSAAKGNTRPGDNPTDRMLNEHSLERRNWVPTGSRFRMPPWPRAYPSPASAVPSAPVELGFVRRHQSIRRRRARLCGLWRAVAVGVDHRRPACDRDDPRPSRPAAGVPTPHAAAAAQRGLRDDPS